MRGTTKTVTGPGVGVSTTERWRVGEVNGTIKGKKQVLHYAYPIDSSVHGAPKRSVQDDTCSLCCCSCFPTHVAMRLRHGWGTRFCSRTIEKQKQVLQYAYPMDSSVHGAPKRSVQDDTCSLCCWSCFPTHVAMRLRHGWGTRFCSRTIEKQKQVLHYACPMDSLSSRGPSVQDDTVFW
jgi:hypothetical protein